MRGCAAIPARFTGGSAPVTVTAVAAGQSITDTAIAVNLVGGDAALQDPAAFGPRPVKPLSGLFRHKVFLYVGLLGLFAGVGALLAFALNGIASRPASMQGRLRPFVDSGTGQPKERPARTVRGTALGIADEIVKQRGLEESLTRRLDAGGIPLRASEWLILHVGFAILFPLLVMLLTDLNPALSITAVVLGIVGPFGYLAVKESMRTRKFLAQLPDTLQLL